ncbi:hypothetical protein Cni_G01705 [Canna indica]|uniref:Wall-associated receptor kinase galacturonan-binding domain-containing protein n=1 Tax=Canna indica TaxID=4628 RepID=A0AAQ3JPN4_9LILI|nr:hypothetical protein Cni_G01705 [Canna indica]
MIDDCAPQSCGNVKIGYPFWISGKQPSYCGFPPYNITCSSSDDNKTQIPLLTVAGFSNIHVKNIYYDDHSIQLAPARYDTDDPCALLFINVSALDIFPFIRSSSNKQISFLYNCSKELPFYRNTSCVVDSKPIYFSGEYNHSKQLNFSGGSCTLVVAPVMGYFDLSTDVNYTVLLRAGSLVNWTAPDCKECHDSGGRCGYNSSTIMWEIFTVGRGRSSS